LLLPERFKRLQKLEMTLKTAEAAIEKKAGNEARNKNQETQLLADEDGIIELRCRLALERAEYLALKEITPDYVEPATEV
jgi:hypothetical protein